MNIQKKEITAEYLLKLNFFDRKIDYLDKKYNIYINIYGVIIIKLDNIYYINEKKYLFNKDIIDKGDEIIIQEVLLNFDEHYLKIKTLKELYDFILKTKTIPLNKLDDDFINL